MKNQNICSFYLQSHGLNMKSFFSICLTPPIIKISELRSDQFIFEILKTCFSGGKNNKIKLLLDFKYFNFCFYTHFLKEWERNSSFPWTLLKTPTQTIWLALNVMTHCDLIGILTIFFSFFTFLGFFPEEKVCFCFPHDNNGFKDDSSFPCFKYSAQDTPLAGQKKCWGSAKLIGDLDMSQWH